MTRIGGDHDQLTTAGTTLDSTGEEASATASEFRQSSSVAREGVERVGQTLRSQIESMRAELSQKVANHTAMLEQTDWQGQSKEQALAAAQSIQQRIDATCDQALEMAEQLATSERETVESLCAQIEGDFTRMMSQADAAYHAEGQRARSMQAGLAAADQTIKFTG